MPIIRRLSTAEVASKYNFKQAPPNGLEGDSTPEPPQLKFLINTNKGNIPLITGSPFVYQQGYFHESLVLGGYDPSMHRIPSDFRDQESDSSEPCGDSKKEPKLITELKDPNQERVRVTAKMEPNLSQDNRIYTAAWKYNDVPIGKSSGEHNPSELDTSYRLEWKIDRGEYLRHILGECSPEGSTLRPVSKVRYEISPIRREASDFFTSTHCKRMKKAFIEIYYGEQEVPGSANLGGFAVLEIQYDNDPVNADVVRADIERFRNQLAEEEDFLPFIVGEISANPLIQNRNLALYGVPEKIFYRGRQQNFQTPFVELRDSITFADYKAQYTEKWFKPLRENRQSYRDRLKLHDQS